MCRESPRRRDLAIGFAQIEPKKLPELIEWLEGLRRALRPGNCQPDQSGGAKWVGGPERRYGRQGRHKKPVKSQTAEPPCHGGPRARSAPVLLLRDGPHGRADPPAF